MTANELYALLDKAGIDYDIVEIFDGARFLRIEVDDSFKHGKLWHCQGYWNDSRQPMTCLVCDGEWDGIEDDADAHITYYTEGQPVVGDHGEFTVTDAEEYTPDWWENKMAGVQIP